MKRLTPERLAAFERFADTTERGASLVAEVLNELHAVTRERDELRQTLKEWTPIVLMNAAKKALEDAVKP